jgi:elongation factor G
VNTYSATDIRNAVLVGHGGSGKTSLCEALLYTSGATGRLGKVEEGTTHSDFLDEEKARQISISTALLSAEWRNAKLNLLDTPGYQDFLGEAVSGLAAAESALFVLRSAAGVEVASQQLWERSKAHDQSRFLVVNQLSHEQANFDACLSDSQEHLGREVTPLHLPVNPGVGFNGIVDLVRMKAYTYEPGGNGKGQEGSIPEELIEEAEALRENLIDQIAESDDALMEKYLDEGELSDDDFRAGLRAAIRASTLYPLLCTDAASNVGSDLVMDALVAFAPSPADTTGAVGAVPGNGEQVIHPPAEGAPTALQIFKIRWVPILGEMFFFRLYSGMLRSGTDLVNASAGGSERIGQIYQLNGDERNEVGTVGPGDMGGLVKLKGVHTGDTLCDKNRSIVLPRLEFPEPAIRMAVVPRAKGDEEKISTGLHRLQEEDPSFSVEHSAELRQTIISGQGELHLEVVVNRLHDKFGVEVDTAEPRVPYRETIRTDAEGYHRHKKQTGGRGQFGEVYLRLHPLKRGAGFEFVHKIVGGVIPSQYIPAVEKGINETLASGILANCPVVDVQVDVYDGSYHAVDSSEMAFKLAASMAFKDGFMKAKPALLEPTYDVEILVPEAFAGDVMSDLSSRRGKIQGMERNGAFEVVRAQVPLAEMYRYSTTLRSMTRGQGTHRRRFSHYQEVPTEEMEKALVKAKPPEEQA